MAESRAQRRAGLINAMRMAGVPVNEVDLSPLTAEDYLPTPGIWPPATGQELAAAERVRVGMFATDEPLSDDKIVEDLRRLEQFSYFATFSLKRGLRDLGIRHGASVIRTIERLADLGSEDAGASLLQAADHLRELGILDDAVAMAKEPASVGGPP